jgi:hypothetical protein
MNEQVTNEFIRNLELYLNQCEQAKQKPEKNDFRVWLQEKEAIPENENYI